MNISTDKKSIACRISVTAIITVATAMLWWYLTTVLPSQLSDFPWLIVIGYIITSVATMGCMIIFVGMWKEERVLAVILMVVIIIGVGIFCFIPEPERTLFDKLYMLFGTIIALELVALTAYEYIAKRVCKLVFGVHH
jgi:hypothetical protein